MRNPKSEIRNPNQIQNPKIPDRSDLLTERRLAESMELDRLPIEEALAVMNGQDQIAVKAVAGQRAEIARAVEWVADALERRAGG